MNINWYPGHMAKTKRDLAAVVTLTDIIIEILDARAPLASKNPDIDSLSRNLRKITLLNKADLADADTNLLWAGYFSKNGAAFLCDAKTGEGAKKVLKAIGEIACEKRERQKKRGRRSAPARVMVCGIPNVGKSTFINVFASSKKAKTANYPGVTKTAQWVRINETLELLDTPGILAPKQGDTGVMVKLAAIGAVKSAAFDAHELSLNLIELVKNVKAGALRERFGASLGEDAPPEEILAQICAIRGLVKKGGEGDLPRAALVLTNEFKSGKLGRVSLEKP